MVHLRKERFPNKIKSKLKPMADDPFEVLTKVNDNAYKIDLPSDYGVFATFNVRDLSPYLENNNKLDLRTNPSQLQEDDMILKTDQKVQGDVSPITHAMAQKT